MVSKAEAARGRWALAAVFMANGFVMGSWAPQIPLLLPRHQIGEAVLGLLILGLGLGAVGAMAASGGLIARYGSRPVLRVFALLTSATMMPVVLAPSLWVLAPAMAVMGGLVGCMDVAMNANAVEVERRLGRAIMSSSHGFWSLGGFCGGLLGGPVIAALGAAGHAWAASAVVLALVLGASPWLIHVPPAPQEAATAPVKRWPTEPAVYILGLMALFCMVPEGAVLDWAAIYLAQEMATPVAQSGLAFGFFAGLMAVMRFAGDSVRNRFGAVKTLRVSGLVAAAGLLGASVAPTMPIAVACFALSGLGVANTVPIMFSAAGNLPGLASGVGISTVTMLGYAGILVAPSTIGFVAAEVGFRWTYAVLALLFLAVVLMARRVAVADWAHG